MTRLRAAVALVMRFFWEIVASGFATAWFIVRPGPRPSPVLVEMPIGDLSATGAALLGCLVTLTPGTSVVDLDLDRRRLTVHLLDGSDPAGAVSAIRRGIARHLAALCPGGGR